MSRRSAQKPYRRIGVAVAALVAIAVCVSLSPLHAKRESKNAVNGAAKLSQSNNTALKHRALANYAALPVSFEANQGQTDPQVKYMARGNGYKLYLTSSQAILRVSGRHGDSDVRDMMMNKRRGAAETKAWIKKRYGNAHRGSSSQAEVRMNLLGPGAEATLSANEPQHAKLNYFIGKDPAKWLTNVPLYGRVNYSNVYPGIDLAFHGTAQRLEFDYLVSPGADPKPIQVSFEGIDKLQTNESGDLILTTSAGPVELHKPVAYQVKDGVRSDVDARFVIKGHDQIAFAVGAYDHSRELVIDPTVFYSTYFGGDFADYGIAIAVDANGNSYVAGATDSNTLPGPAGSTVTASAGTFDAFVTKIDTNGACVFTSIFGGTTGDDFPGGIAVDAQGIYIGGTTSSSDFPTTAGAPQTIFQGGTTNGANDAFAVKLDLTGSLPPVWGTYIGGSDSDSGLGVAVDASHNVYVVGETYSGNLPVTDGSILNLNSGSGNDDGYIAGVNATGTAFIQMRYIGGSSGDLATGVSIDGSGNIYISGITISSDLPVTAGVLQPSCGTDGNCNAVGSTGPFDDLFIASIKANLSGYNYITYFGGSVTDDAYAIAADASGNVFLTGRTTSPDFLLSGGTPFQSQLLGTQNAFILGLNNTGSALAYESYFGGEASDLGTGIALDSGDNIYITGQTTSATQFPLLNPTQPAPSGNSDAFVSVFGLNQNLLLFSTFLGGGGDENQFAGAIGVDAAENIYVTGDTDSGNGNSPSFPTTTGAIGSTSGGGTCGSGAATVPCTDAFVTSYTPATAPDFTLSATALNPSSINAGASATSTITVTALNAYAGTVNLTCSVSGTGTPLPTCSTGALAGGAATLTVTTTGAAAAVHHSSSIFVAMGLPLVGLSLIGMRLSRKDSRKKKLLGFLLLGIVMAMLFFLPACGGSSSGGGGGGGGGGCSGCTPAGNYTVTVTGTDSVNANLTHTAPTLSLTVN